MKIIRASLWSISSLGILVMLAAWYGGFFEAMDVRQQEINPFYISYRFYEGSPASMRNATDELIDDLKQEGVSVYKTVFIIKDKKGSQDINALIGCIIGKDEHDKLNVVREKFLIVRIDPGFCIIGSMVYENWLNLYAAEWRLRPVLEGMGEKLKMKPFSILEVRNRDGGEINYILIEDRHLPPEISLSVK